jgi:hypothetical protein
VDDPNTESRHTAVVRRKTAHFVGSRVLPQAEADEVSFGSPSFDADEEDLGHAVESKKRDNLVLGEALVSIGLLQRHELSNVQTAQADSTDVVGSLTVASAIRSRLGEILLKAKRISSSQLEYALELQRERGGLLGEILVGLGWLDQHALAVALAEQAVRKWA